MVGKLTPQSTSLMSGQSSRNASNKQAILQAAVAVLAKNPGVSLSDVAGKCGIGRATLYRHFSSREALIREIAFAAIEAIDQVTAHIRNQNLSAADALLAFLEGVVPLGDRFHFLVAESSTYTDPDINAAYARQMQELNDFVNVLKQDGVIALDVPNAWVATAIDSLIWAAWSAIQSGDIARNDAAKLTYRTLIQGLKH
ncbi:transcriptional regulator [Leptolyngbya sp. PCC 7375]|nr:transcriptional regulator [Leptolyngbya sp. PCC 7375]